MDFAKSLFQSTVNDRKGYVTVNNAHKLALVESACDDPDPDPEGTYVGRTGSAMDRNGSGLCQTINLKPGVPFSGITPSMWPTTKSDAVGTGAGAGSEPNTDNENVNEDEDDDGILLFDELGFRLEKPTVANDDDDDNVDDVNVNGTDAAAEEGSVCGSPVVANRVLGCNNNIPFEEDDGARLQWLAYLEFSHSREEVQELSWDSIPNRIPLTQKLWEMMTRAGGGVPHSLRPQIWLRLSGALEKKANPMNLPYWKVVKESAANEYFSFAKLIEKDLTRILPGNVCFSSFDSPGIPRLRRVLRALAWLYPDLGYCQGMGTIVAHLLLFLEEEDCFWLMCTIIEDLLPPTSYLSDFIGIRVDTAVLSYFVSVYFPEIHELLKEHDIDLSLILFNWFLSIFASVIHVKFLLRIWDLFFAEGDVVLFKVMLALIKYKDHELLQLSNSAEIFNFLSDLPSTLVSFDALDLDHFGDLNSNSVEVERKRIVPQVVSGEGGSGSTFSANTYKSRRVKKRTNKKVEKSSNASILKSIFGNDANNVKNKNVRQTELMVDLHEAILQIGRHFIANDAKFVKASLEPDFSIESHERDHDRFSVGITNGVRRAKALFDFERRDDDELGFRKNDILVILNSKDEHCWIGELNGLRGWFPSRLVAVLDERSKQYSPAGDDSVTEGIADLARGVLCPALKRIFEHGMKRPSSLIPVHPWLFIEEVARKEIERDFRSVYSRLVLCKTYRLDEDGKVLSPEELLYRCVDVVNRSHEKVQMDVKFRSLICLGLNEQVLHLWIEIFCSSAEVLNKWYHPWSFLNSPGFIGLKCELRVLAQFSFSLSLEWELKPPVKKEKSELKTDVKDMLVKHHLFSWNL